jgi:hypothetical protein
MAIAISDISPADLLGRFRGPITEAYHGYPEVILFDVKDSEGGEWHFVTWDADYSPSDPDALLGKVVVSADLDEEPGALTIGFSDGSAFKVTPVFYEPVDDLEHWELFTPEGLVLHLGPGSRWRLGEASDPC